MADDKKPDPVDDLKKGFGLLFRAAKGAVDKLPADKLEEIVVSGVKEVGRAIESVTDQIDRQVFGGKGTVPHPGDGTAGKEHKKHEEGGEEPKAAAPTPTREADPGEKKPAADAKAEPPTDEPPKGPRVA